MAQLTIQFTRDTLTTGFYLGVDVLSGVDVDPVCLVATVGLGSSVERLARIATLNDFVDIPPAPITDGYNYFYCADFAGVVPVFGDIIKIDSVPPLWAHLGYASGTQHHVISYDPSYKVVQVGVGDEFPAYGGPLSFSLYDSGLVLRSAFTTAGYASLDVYDGSWNTETYYRLQTINVAIDDLQTAIDKYVSLQTEAQSLVDNTENYLDNYEGTDTEIYT